MSEYRGPSHKAQILNYHTHAFLFNIRNYSHEVRNVQPHKAKLNINLLRVSNFDFKLKMAWNQQTSEKKVTKKTN